MISRRNNTKMRKKLRHGGAVIYALTVATIVSSSGVVLGQCANAVMNYYRGPGVITINGMVTYISPSSGDYKKLFLKVLDAMGGGIGRGEKLMLVDFISNLDVNNMFDFTKPISSTSVSSSARLHRSLSSPSLVRGGSPLGN